MRCERGGTAGEVTMLRGVDIRCQWFGAPVAGSAGRIRTGDYGSVRRRGLVVRATTMGDGKGNVSLPHVQGRKRVVLVRHGQSTWNEIGRIQGSSDFSRLTSKGESQAAISRQMLSSDSFDVCIHSPLSRAKHTAEIIWDARSKDAVISLDDLREIDLYAFQGLDKEHGKELFGDAYRMWKEDPANFLIDGHYPVRELWERASSCWSSILGHEGSSILVVAHNAVNQALVATATGLGPRYFRYLLQSNCGVSVLDFNPRTAAEGLPPHVSLERLNHTPTSALSGEQSAGRKTRTRIVLVCHGATASSVTKNTAASSGLEPLNVLGNIQSAKIAEHLLNVPVHTLFCSPQPSAVQTAAIVSRYLERADLKVVSLDELKDLDWGTWREGRSQDGEQRNAYAGAVKSDSIFTRAGHAWQTLTQHLESVQAENGEGTVAVVGHDVLLEAMLCHCLGLDDTFSGTFQFHNGGLSVIDFPDGALGRGVVRCLNYTAHLDRWAVPVTRR
ncbi:2-carboxy-D-arabinitol-1-phosphatase [Marchantia polymorpha subsp. ruderalis]|uniref:2-carboxy-D-arabinitol-1-phosphatase n=2 Tax=Marchantia polymorpha TaxID=3197 RepID=A0AAF6ANQ9_MARPO|nr:hypothetical protein MARPO_0014s0161 [Marchantia polymorpha]BBM98079.1 hypothetical protein Mp_1g10660 [Marchantia polymorpha subsp. ruderalis]|eukprot:PTQ45646.1 hypothetical protein MARPO_0014s0161 [Marchantia polymorpha]